IAPLSRAQSRPGQPAKAKLRQRVIELRTEVDLLQVHADATRAVLLDALKTQCERDVAGKKESEEIRSDLESAKTMETVHALPAVLESMIKRGVRPDDLAAIAKQVDEERGGKDVVEEMVSKLRRSGKVSEEDLMKLRCFLEGGTGADASLARLVQSELKARNDSSRAAIERAQQEFARKARVLNEMKLDLADAEKQHQTEAR